MEKVDTANQLNSQLNQLKEVRDGLYKVDASILAGVVQGIYDHIKENDLVFIIPFNNASYMAHIPTYKNKASRFKRITLVKLKELVIELSSNQPNYNRVLALLNQLIESNFHISDVKEIIRKWKPLARFKIQHYVIGV